MTFLEHVLPWTSESPSGQRVGGEAGSGTQGLETTDRVSATMRRDHQPCSFCAGCWDIVCSSEPGSESTGTRGAKQGGVIPETTSGGGDVQLEDVSPVQVLCHDLLAV